MARIFAFLDLELKQASGNLGLDRSFSCEGVLIGADIKQDAQAFFFVAEKDVHIPKGFLQEIRALCGAHHLVEIVFAFFGVEIDSGLIDLQSDRVVDARSAVSACDPRKQVETLLGGLGCFWRPLAATACAWAVVFLARRASACRSAALFELDTDLGVKHRKSFREGPHFGGLAKT